MSTSLQGKTIAILATDGFEQVELTEPKQAVEQAGATTRLLSLKAGEIQGMHHDKEGDTFKVDGLVASARDHGITLVGPPPADNQWQARTEGAFAIEQFDLDWDPQIATCPAGQTSEGWIPDTHGGHDNVRIRFSLTHCKACPLKARCTPLCANDRETNATRKFILEGVRIRSCRCPP